MLYNIYNLCRVLCLQFVEFFNCNNYLNYEEELVKTISSFKKLNEEKNIHRNTQDIGTLFRHHNKKHKGFTLDNLNGIINIDIENKWIDVGGKTRYYDIVKHTLKYNLIPKIVPELSSITVGGSITGISIESSSFKYGWGHDSVLDMDILTSSGEVHYATKENEYSDLFKAIPNSYGTIGYVTRAKLELIEAKPYVKLFNMKYNNIDDAFEALNIAVNNKDADFVDAVVYSQNNIIVVLGFMCNEPNSIGDSCDLSNYPRNGVYYETIKKLRYDSMTIYDYLWRWDADMFWGATDVSILNNKWFRWIFGRCLLNTRVLRSIQPIFRKYKKKSNKEKIIQDLGIPKENAVEFLKWICTHINEYPLWICPVKPKNTDTPLWSFNDNKLYYDIGVFVRKKHFNNEFPYYYNKLIEEKLLELGGNKCFYSDTFFTKSQFDSVIDSFTYKTLKNKYDSNNKFGDLYKKIIHTET